MDDNPKLIMIYWIESHKESEQLESFIYDINNQKTVIKPIYISKDIKQNYILSIFMYSIKNDFELNFISEFFDKGIKHKRKIFIEMKNIKNEHYFLYNFIPSEEITQENQFILYLQMIENKYKVDNELIKRILFINTKNLLNRDKNYFDLILYYSVFVESYKDKEFIFKYSVIFNSLLKKKIIINHVTPERFQKFEEKINYLENNNEIISQFFEGNKKQIITELI